MPEQTPQQTVPTKEGAPAGFAGATGTPLEVDIEPGTVTIMLDGRPVKAKKGEMLIAAAERAGNYIPRFCYHPRMKPVGMCRMCLVDIKGPRGFTLTPACYAPVTEGMEVDTGNAKVKKAQDGVLEFLLVNHPLDCPVCDKGGECPLQDQTIAYGPGETRFVEEKRHWDKPVPLSELVLIDRERCIQCARCTRFAEEVAGDAGIDFAARSDTTEVAIFPSEPFVSNFSGNVVQICPVGALLGTPYRFKARPWDLEQVESTCTLCSVGCRVAVQSSSDQVVRFIGVDSDPVNWGWLCDKGRFGFEALNNPDRLAQPLARPPVAAGSGSTGVGGAGVGGAGARATAGHDQLVETSWSEALSLVASRLSGADGTRVGVIGGARLPNEDAYAWAKLARSVLHTDNVDAQLGDGLPADLVAALPRATIDEVADAAVIVLVAPDIKEELPVLYLRLRHAAVEKGARIIEVSPGPTGLSSRSAQSLRYQPGTLASVVAAISGSAEVTAETGGVAAADLEAARQAITAAEAPVVVLGRPSLAEPALGAVQAALSLAALPGARFLSALRRSNVHGAIDLGLAPGLLPGRVSLAAGRGWYESRWGTRLPKEAGLDTLGMLTAAAAGMIDVLILLGADPVSDCPDSELAVLALQRARFVVAVDTFTTASTAYADVVLPAATYTERRGSFTNIEGRVTWLGQKVTAPGTARPDWVIAAELASRLGGDLGVASVEDIWAEVQSVSPLHQGVPIELLVSRQGRNGVVVPLGAGGAPAGDAASPLDPMADPGISSAEVHPAPPVALSVAGAGTGRADAPAIGTGTAATSPALAPPGPGQPAPPSMVTLSAVRSSVLARATDTGGGPGAASAGAGVQAAPGAPASAAKLSLRLVATRPMWDGGAFVQRSPSLAGLHPGIVLRAHPDDLALLSLGSSPRARVSSHRGALVVDVVADTRVSRGTALLPFNLPDGGAGTLIDASAASTEVQVEVAQGSAEVAP